MLIFIGGISVFMTTSIIFDWFDIRIKEGNFVWFIVFANFICGFIYLFASIMNWKNPKYSIMSLGMASVILIIAFIFLKIYINDGGIYEPKTVTAMLFRITFTIIMTVISCVVLKNEKQQSKY